jgi:hypothetical protein
MPEHRTACDAMQHLGQLRAHARSAAGGKYHGEQRSAHAETLKAERIGCKLSFPTAVRKSRYFTVVFETSRPTHLQPFPDGPDYPQIVHSCIAPLR